MRSIHDWFPYLARFLRLLVVTAELESHRRKQLVLEVGLAARGEPLVKGRAEDWRRHAFIDGRLDGPSTFARIGYSASELLIVPDRLTSETAVKSSNQEAITLPRRHTSAMSRKLKSYWYCSGSRSGVVSASMSCGCLPMFASRRMPNPSAYAAMSAVLDSVVDHLHEMARAVWAAVEVTVFSRAAELLATRRLRDIADSGANVAKIGSRRLTTSSSPPIIMQ